MDNNLDWFETLKSTIITRKPTRTDALERIDHLVAKGRISIEESYRLEEIAEAHCSAVSVQETLDDVNTRLSVVEAKVGDNPALAMGMPNTEA